MQAAHIAGETASVRDVGHDQTLSCDNFRETAVAVVGRVYDPAAMVSQNQTVYTDVAYASLYR
jgi:hypothetical protein